MAITNRALAFATRWFDADTVRRTFEPLIADWQREWQDATPAQRRWVLLRGLLAFLLAVIVSSPQVMFAPALPETMQRVAVRMVRATAIVTALLMVPAVIDLWHWWTVGASWMRGSLFVYAVPGALALAFPFTMMGAVDAIRGDRTVAAHFERAAALRVGVLATVFMLIFGGWVLPATNEASRNAMNPAGMGAPLRGITELTTTELIFDPARATVFAPGTYLASRSTSVQRELNRRAAMAILPLVLIWMRWRALNHRRRRFSPLPEALAVPISIAALGAATASGFWIEREWHGWAGTHYWAPIAVFALWGVLSSYGRGFLHPRSAQAGR